MFVAALKCGHNEHREVIHWNEITLMMLQNETLIDKLTVSLKQDLL